MAYVKWTETPMKHDAAMVEAQREIAEQLCQIADLLAGVTWVDTKNAKGAVNIAIDRGLSKC